MVIKDPMLAETIACSLHKSKEDITIEDLQNITSIHARGLNIQSLEGLEHCENITHLDVSGNQIEVLEPLSHLHSLEYINLSKNFLHDISALRDFRNLKRLDLSRNHLFVMYLEGCRHLKKLWLGIENGPFPLGILGTLSELKELHMNKMWMYEISDLTYLRHLEVLDLSTNLFSDLSPITSMTHLKSINLANNKYLKNYEVLKQMPELEGLDISYNELSDFSFLKDLPFLKVFHASLRETGYFRQSCRTFGCIARNETSALFQCE